MKRLRITLFAYSFALPLWMAATHATSLAWVLTVGVVVGMQLAVVVTLLPNPWE